MRRVLTNWHLKLKHLISLPLALVWILVLCFPVFAIAPPSTYQINQVNVYQHCAEAGDQLYLTTFTLDYTGANPPEDAGEAWIVRLLDAGGAELEATAVYAFYNDGYVPGCMGLYFSAADAPAWSGAYTMELVGNPTLSWNGTAPSDDESTFTWSSSTGQGQTSTELTARVRVLMKAYEDDWGVDLREQVAGSWKLTAFGMDYFMTTIPHLQAICPDLFSAMVIVPEFEERDYTQTEATTSEARWVGDDLLDLTSLANILGVSRIWATSLLWIGMSIGMCVFVSRKVMDYKIIGLLFSVMLIVGAIIGLMPFIVAPVIGAACVVAIVYTFAWGGAQ